MLYVINAIKPVLRLFNFASVGSTCLQNPNYDFVYLLTVTVKELGGLYLSS